MNWNRIELYRGQRVELRVCDAQASRWMPAVVCGVLIARGNEPLYQIEEQDGQLRWAGRERLRTMPDDTDKIANRNMP